MPLGISDRNNTTGDQKFGLMNLSNTCNMLFDAFILPQASGTLRLLEVIKDYSESADTFLSEQTCQLM